MMLWFEGVRVSWICSRKHTRCLHLLSWKEAHTQEHRSVAAGTPSVSMHPDVPTGLLRLLFWVLSRLAWDRHMLFVPCCGERGSARSLSQDWSSLLVLQQTKDSPGCTNSNLCTPMLSQNTEQQCTKFPNSIHFIPYLG